VNTQTVDEITSRIEAARKNAPGGVVAFDGDGTLWSGDVGEDFFYGMIEGGDIRADAMDALRKEARDAELFDGGTGAEIARRIYDAYLAHKFDEERVCEIMTWVSAGWDHDELASFCDQVLARRELHTRLHGEVQHVVEFAKAQGIELYLVSASPLGIIEAAARVAGLPHDNIVAARCGVQDGTMLATVARPIPYGPGKVTRLRERIGTRPLYAAFGDNAFDVPMLKEAVVGVAVRPKPRLRDKAGDVPGLVELISFGRVSA
jgi:phosphatidylglycerophosphatase C